MKTFFKVLFVILFVLIFTCGIIFGVFAYEGYHMYQEALKEASLEEKVAEIRSKKDYLKIDKIPLTFKNALIAIEDHRFESHGAVDFISIARAILVNITERDLVQGGSTITQQLAKNTFFTQESSLSRKIAEIFAAADIENNYSKDEIIELYMNIIYFGDGYYGINAASHGYYNKEPLELNLDEITILAGLPNAPSVYSPSNNPDLARQRQKQVISRMVEYGYLSQEEADTLK